MVGLNKTNINDEVYQRFYNEVIEDFDEYFTAVVIPSGKDDGRFILMIVDTGDEELRDFLILKNPKKLAWPEKVEERIDHCFLVGGTAGSDGRERAVRVCEEEGKVYLYYEPQPYANHDLYELDIEKKGVSK